MRNYLLLLALAGARACTPGTNLPNAKKCCPDGTESPYYNGGVGYACCGEAPDRMAQTRPFAATATPVAGGDYKQETSLVVGMTAASKI